jgi:phage shock protein A
MPSQGPSPDALRAINDLREQLASLERDAATLEQDLSRLQSSANEAVERAMEAVGAGNDVLAREHLRNHERHADAAAKTQAELQVVTATIETCREVLSAFPPQVT